jgi:diguanylate cyclase (GGDEF)-like protein/PAS domain S-box-containing protein
VLCVLAVVLLSGAHRAWESAIADKRFAAFPRPASGDIVLVAIDPYSLDKIGAWPWPRSLHGEVIGRLAAAGARDIAFDVDFSAPSNPVFDQAFADALQDAGGSVVLPSFAQVALGRGGGIHVNRPLPVFGELSWPAVVNVAVGTDGLVRRYSFAEMLDGKLVPSLGAMIAGVPAPHAAPFLIDFSINADSVPIVSYADILLGEPAALARVKDKKVIIGATAIELGDHFSVPGRVIPGPLLQALAAESILQGRTLHHSSTLVTGAGLLLIALLMAVLWRRFSASTRVVVIVGLAVAIELAATLLQAHSPIMLDTAHWHVALAAYLGALALDEIDFLGLLRLVAERRFQQIAMSLGDGLVCANHDGRITVWNPGASAIFGYERRDMMGEPLDKIFAASPGKPFSIADVPREALQLPGGKVLELEGRKQNGEAFPLDACFFGWQGTDGFQYGAVLRDISVRKREAEHIRHLAEYDTLTGLANRNALQERLLAAVAAAREQRSQVALLVIDIDKFKHINDTLGDACGDQMLCMVAERLAAVVAGADLLARLGGDDFAIMLTGTDAGARAIELAQRTLLALNKSPLMVGPRELNIAISIGVAVYPEHCGSAEGLLGNADLALHRAKAIGRGRHVVFDRVIRDELEARLLLEVELERAVDRGEFELFYQPQVDLADGRIVGVEALLRWHHPERGLLLPGDFIAVANASSMAGAMARWVMDTACRQGRLWLQKGYVLRVGVNLAAPQLQAADLAATVEAVLQETGFSPALLELEVTEDVLLEDDERARELFRRLRSLGVGIALDDFGTGYASLSYLKKFPLDRLKIDRSFVCDLRLETHDAAIVSSTITLAKLLGLSVIAEGIENRAAADLLSSMGCAEGQGFYFGRPMPAAELERRLLLEEAEAPARDATAA